MDKLISKISINRTIIYIYNGAGSNAKSVEHLKRGITNSLQQIGSLGKLFLIQTINDYDILGSDQWISHAALFCIGGGRDLIISQALGRQGCDKIRKYVLDGGSYLGICCGAYFGTCNIEFDKDGPLEVCGERHLKLYAGKAIGPVLSSYEYDSEKGSLAAKIRKKSLFANKEENDSGDCLSVYYNGGCVFVPSMNSATSEIFHPDFYQESVNYVYSAEQTVMNTINSVDLSAIVKIKISSSKLSSENQSYGRVVLSGVHLEYDYKLLNDTDEYTALIVNDLARDDEKRMKLLSKLLSWLLRLKQKHQL